MIRLAEHNFCTGCGACAYKCPKHCISMQEDAIGIIYPIIDNTTCIECHTCEKSCPILNKIELHKPFKAFAAWSNDTEERRTSASGGIAAEIYKEALVQGYYIAGAVQNLNFSVTLELSNEKELISSFKNSKYVFSSAYTLFSDIKTVLSQGNNIVVIGLPCQIAAIRKLFRDNERLLLIDVVCHGTTPLVYLQQHIHKIEKRIGERAVRMSFRDPIANTNTFTFTLYNSEGQLFYSAPDGKGDTYQEGYHRMISYRENCYHCMFAQQKRNSDLTLSDYKGLGVMAPCNFNNLKVSSVLVNTKKGLDFLDILIKNENITAKERPIDEPINGDPQLQHPSLKSRRRKYFEKYINKKPLDYENTMSIIEKLNNRWKYYDFIVKQKNRIVNKTKKFFK